MSEAVRIAGSVLCFRNIFVRNVFRSVKYLTTYARSVGRNACVCLHVKCPLFVSFYLAHNKKDSVKLYNIGFDENPFVGPLVSADRRTYMAELMDAFYSFPLRTLKKWIFLSEIAQIFAINNATKFALATDRPVVLQFRTYSIFASRPCTVHSCR
jgi:hypothetical protein